MSEAVFSESLAYASMKKRSVSARSFRTKIAPSNGSTFAADSTVQIDLPGNLQGQYFDFSSMYLKFKLTSDTALHLDRGGAFGLFKRLQLSVAGAQLADINSYGVLCTAMLDTDASAEWKAGYGNICAGTIGDALTGVAQAADAAGARVYCVPIVLNPLFNTTGHRLIPAFSLSAIQMRLQIDSAASCVVAAAVPVLAFSEVELCCMMTELSPQAQAQVDAACGGNYTILANSFMNSQATLAANETQLTANLGFSVSSLERIIAVHRPTATIAANAAYSLGNRTTSGLVQYKYLINAESYPQRDVVVGDHGAESTAEMLIADHALVDFNKGSALNNGVAITTSTVPALVGALSGSNPNIAKSACFMLKDGAGTSAGVGIIAGATAVASNIGTFMISTDFENGLSVGKSSSIYSGVSTIASSVQWLGTYSGAHAAAQVDFFACFSVLMTLNTRGAAVWQISV
jgi:hypothetical protein